MSFILEALKKVDRKKDGAQDGVVMQGGRRWGDARFPWELAAVVLVAVVALALATVAILRSFQGGEAGVPLRSGERGVTVEGQTPPPSPPNVPAEEKVTESLESIPSPDERSVPEAREVSPVPAVGRAETPEAPASIGTEAVPANEETQVMAGVEEVGPAPPVTLVGRASDDSAPAEVDNGADEQPPSELPSLVLQGTSVIDGKAVAVVNYQRLFEGDFIGGARVVKILDRAVELEFKGTRFTIRL
jgi:hypothetical protein